MRNLLIGILLLLMPISLFCQQITFSQPLPQQHYVQKSKKQKTAAWVLLGGGFALAVGAPILAVSSDWSKPELPYDIAFLTGCASILGSIPLFIASGRNKRKTLHSSACFDIRRNPVATNTGLTLHATPTVSLHLDF